MVAKPKLLYVVTEDWYFVLHWLRLARAARDAGFDVGVAVRVSKDKGPITASGLPLFPLNYLRRSSVNPFIEAAAVLELTGLYRRWRPSLVHHVAAKPVIYGGIAARRAGVPAVVSALAGLGFVYTSDSHRARLLKPAALSAYRSALRHSHSRLIVQNKDDHAAVQVEGLIEPTRIRIVDGSGVDVSKFTPVSEPPAPITVVLAGRMLWDKGVGEFVEAARLLRAAGSGARFVLVGDIDGENPSSIPREILDTWTREGVVEWWGHRADMPSVLQQAHIVCLPSYREGLPTVLLEAAACARPLIATDVPGCREIVQHEQTGLLVPVRDAKSLAHAISVLLADAVLRERLGERGRELVTSRYTTDHVNAATLSIYAELLDEVGSAEALYSTPAP